MDETVIFLDHFYLDYTQRECETSKDIADNYRNMFETRISVSGKKKLPFSLLRDDQLSKVEG